MHGFKSVKRSHGRDRDGAPKPNRGEKDRQVRRDTPLGWVGCLLAILFLVVKPVCLQPRLSSTPSSQSHRPTPVTLEFGVSSRSIRSVGNSVRRGPERRPLALPEGGKRWVCRTFERCRPENALGISSQANQSRGVPDLCAMIRGANTRRAKVPMIARTPAKISTDHPTSRPVSNRTTPITTRATSTAYGTRSQNSRRRFACIPPSCADLLRGHRHDPAGRINFIGQLLRSVPFLTGGPPRASGT